MSLTLFKTPSNIENNTLVTQSLQNPNIWDFFPIWIKYIKKEFVRNKNRTIKYFKQIPDNRIFWEIKIYDIEAQIITITFISPLVTSKIPVISLAPNKQ